MLIQNKKKTVFSHDLWHGHTKTGVLICWYHTTVYNIVPFIRSTTCCWLSLTHFKMNLNYIYIHAHNILYTWSDVYVMMYNHLLAIKAQFLTFMYLYYNSFFQMVSSYWGISLGECGLENHEAISLNSKVQSLVMNSVLWTHDHYSVAKWVCKQEKTQPLPLYGKLSCHYY